MIAGLALLTVTNREDLRYFVRDRRLNSHLNGDWIQYHVTRDSRISHRPIWVAHLEYLRITRFGRVKGRSKGDHSTSLSYEFSGTVRNGVMRHRFHNITAPEEDIMVCYPNLLSGDLLLGMWIGQDFDKSWATGHIVLSRTPRSTKELGRLYNLAILPARVPNPSTTPMVVLAMGEGGDISP